MKSSGQTVILLDQERSTLRLDGLEPWMDESYALQVAQLMRWHPVVVRIPSHYLLPALSSAPPPHPRSQPQPEFTTPPSNPGHLYLTFPQGAAHAASVLAEFHIANAIQSRSGHGPILLPSSRQVLQLAYASTADSRTCWYHFQRTSGQNVTMPGEHETDDKFGSMYMRNSNDHGSFSDGSGPTPFSLVNEQDSAAADGHDSRMASLSALAVPSLSTIYTRRSGYSPALSPSSFHRTVATIPQTSSTSQPPAVGATAPTSPIAALFQEHSIFVGDLAPNVTNADLVAVFRDPTKGLRPDRGPPRRIKPFISCKSAKIMLDANSGLSRGYGFVRFGDELEQRRALIQMQGLYCLSRPMRISHATAKAKAGMSSPASGDSTASSGSRDRAPALLSPPQTPGTEKSLHANTSEPIQEHSPQTSERPSDSIAANTSDAFQLRIILSPMAERYSEHRATVGATSTRTPMTGDSKSWTPSSPRPRSSRSISSSSLSARESVGQGSSNSARNGLIPPPPVTRSYVNAEASRPSVDVTGDSSQSAQDSLIRETSRMTLQHTSTVILRERPNNSPIRTINDVPPEIIAQIVCLSQEGRLSEYLAEQGYSLSQHVDPPKQRNNNFREHSDFGTSPTNMTVTSLNSLAGNTASRGEEIDGGQSPLDSIFASQAQQTMDPHAREILADVSPNTAGSSGDPYNTTVFVGGLSALIAEETLRSFFAPFGEIHYVKVPPGKGCGFVQFVHKTDAARAIEDMQGFAIGGSKIRLSWGRSQYKAAQAAAQATQLGINMAELQILTEASGGELPAAIVGAPIMPRETITHHAEPLPAPLPTPAQAQGFAYISSPPQRSQHRMGEFFDMLGGAHPGDIGPVSIRGFMPYHHNIYNGSNLAYGDPQGIIRDSPNESDSNQGFTGYFAAPPTFENHAPLTRRSPAPQDRLSPSQVRHMEPFQPNWLQLKDEYDRPTLIQQQSPRQATQHSHKGTSLFTLDSAIQMISRPPA